MAKIYFFAILFVGLCGNAQTPVKSLYTDDTNVPGAYYKDLFNDLNNFEGTWLYTNGGTSLTITLQKKIMQNYNDGYIIYYEDILVGGYSYVENNIPKINTLSQLQSNLPNSYSYHIVGNIIAGPGSQFCMNCGPNDRKVLLQFGEPNRDILGMEPEMIFQRVDSGGIQKLKLNFRTISGPIATNGQQQPFTSYTIPFGEYILIKQP